jgi:uncharacterized protein with HEPN domain
MKRGLRVGDYLDHILYAIEKIERYTRDMDLAAFIADELVQDGVLRNLEIVGEASKNIRQDAPEFAQQHAHVPWQVMYAMRNILSHAYHEVDLATVWEVVARNLPELQRDVRAIRAALPDPEAQ